MINLLKKLRKISTQIEIFQTAELLVHRFLPDYLLVHPMGMD